MKSLKKDIIKIILNYITKSKTMKLEEISSAELEALHNMGEKYLAYIGNQIKLNQHIGGKKIKLTDIYNKVNNKLTLILQEIINRINNIEE